MGRTSKKVQASSTQQLQALLRLKMMTDERRVNCYLFCYLFCFSEEIVKHLNYSCLARFFLQHLQTFKSKSANWIQTFVLLYIYHTETFLIIKKIYFLMYSWAPRWYLGGVEVTPTPNIQSAVSLKFEPKVHLCLRSSQIFEKNGASP